MALAITLSIGGGNADISSVTRGGGCDRCAAAIPAIPPDLANGAFWVSIRNNEQPSE
jgi:hypothetical protein